MNSIFGRAILGIAAIAAAVVLLILLRDGGDDEPANGGKAVAERTDAGEDGSAKGGDGAPSGEPSTPSVPTIVVRGGAPVGGVAELEYEAGEQVRFRVRSDAADELHVHGYDVERELPAGRTVTVAFPATIEGIFEAELHGSGEQIAELRIEP
jgi:voltage-gated potassium channel Kch